MRRILSLRAALLVLVALIGTYVLLIPPVIGLANQNDFERFMKPFGITYPPGAAGPDRYFCFADVTFAFTRPEKPLQRYVSSEILFIATALGLNHLISKSQSFDIRFLAFVHLAMLLVVFGKMTKAIRNASRHGRIIGLVLATLIVTDVGYLAYFNTLYSEPAVILFAIAFIAFLFEALRQPRPTNLCLLTASATLLVISKPQHAPLGPVIGLFLIMVPFFRRDWRPLLSYCIAAAVLILSAGVYMALTIRSADRMATLYATVFTGVLLDSDNPRGDLAELGINPNAEIYKGGSAFSSDTAATPGYFPGRCTYGKILKFYLVHPAYLVRRTNRIIQEVMSNRQPMLGNFERGTGHRCQEQAECFSIWDSIRKRLNSIWLAGGFFFVTAGVALFLAIRRGSAYSYGYLLLAAMAGSNFYAAALGDGADYRKHMLLFHLLFDSCCCCAAMFTVAQARQFLAERKVHTRDPRAAEPPGATALLESTAGNEAPRPQPSHRRRGKK